MMHVTVTMITETPAISSFGVISLCDDTNNPFATAIGYINRNHGTDLWSGAVENENGQIIPFSATSQNDASNKIQKITEYKPTI